MHGSPLLEVSNLRVRFPTRHGRVEAVSDMSFTVAEGETVAIVGESGSGKSVTALSVMGLLNSGSIESGSIRFRGEDLTAAEPRRMRQIRGEEIAMVFQNPMAALDPLYTVGNQVAEAIRIHRDVSAAEARARAVELLREVGLPDPERRARSYPHELSGGQQQRVVIAIALSCNPALLIADEPTTALDVTVEAQILRLMRTLQADHGTALLFITHDMGVVAEMADRVVVMYAGKVVEQGTVEQVLREPQNPYTLALLRSIPSPDISRDTLMPAIRGSVPSLLDTPSGCRFHPRCPRVLDRCVREEPPLAALPGQRDSRCWLHLQPDGGLLPAESTDSTESTESTGSADRSARHGAGSIQSGATGVS
ncbi:ABC transporter ATP-binding protein [Prauserella muralis]|uniref:ABC transporter ATP-binding protein n=1 Tax=Prauserella muralis TaxID=588067 RepID=UPI0011ADE9EB|nr:ABC transporter ATP-binding protein [Prauserella muralis]TWE28434.1 peptide/nickel transport system ATP-binding protein/oligopeptide transport system ATP-binding protein [Prauserella muralis]